MFFYDYDLYWYVCEMITRTLNDRIASKIGRGKAIVLIGPRQVGKTTLIKQFLRGEAYQFFDGMIPLPDPCSTRPIPIKSNS